MSDPCRDCCGHTHAAPSPGQPAHAAEPAAGESLASFRIDQMDCPTEENMLRKALDAMPGVRGLSFDLMARTLRVRHTLADTAPLAEAISGLGMSPVLLDVPGRDAAAGAPAAPPPPVRLPWLRMAAAGALAIGSEALAYATGDETSWPVAALALGAILLGGLPTLKKGWFALRHLVLNINLLMTVAVIGAALIGQWPEAAVVIWLFGIAELIEARSLDRARRAIQALTTLAPTTALLRRPDGSWTHTPVAQVAIGDLVRARPGDRIALDGRVENGSSSVDQAPITGESLPVDKTVGDPVYAGSINQHGALEYRVTAAAGQTMLDRIAQSVQEAQAQRAPTQRFIDRFARVYTPAVFAIALLMAVAAPLALGQDWHDSIYRALVLLVIACPCALVISTPVTIVSGLTAAARRGILVKGGAYLEQGRRLKHIAVDKTGTLTHGKPVLTDIVALGDEVSQDRALQIAASLEALSGHPLAHAVLQAYRGDLIGVEEFEALAGRGVKGRIDGDPYLLGNPLLARESGAWNSLLQERLDLLERHGKTAIVLCRADEALAVLAIADTVRGSSREAIDQLRRLGIRTTMLSGDNAATVQAVASQTGIDDARGDLLPQDKLDAIAALGAEGPVGMVGDGINDAPALARADIGFAMGAAGTATAIETADVALMQDDLRKLPEFVALSRRTAAILWQNIAFALGLKLVFFILTLTGDATLWMAVFADTGASLLVVFNGLRLLR